MCYGAELKSEERARKRRKERRKRVGNGEYSQEWWWCCKCYAWLHMLNLVNFCWIVIATMV